MNRDRDRVPLRREHDRVHDACPRPRSGTASGCPRLPRYATERLQATRTSPPPGVPGLTLCRIHHPVGASRSAQCQTGHSSGSAIRSALPATREAAGVPSAWSQPSQSTHERPRRWCDAGSLGRQSVSGTRRPAPRTGPGTATSDRGRGSSSVRDRVRREHAAIAFIGTCRVRSCAGSTHPAPRRAPHNYATGHSTGSAMRSAAPG